MGGKKSVSRIVVTTMQPRQMSDWNESSNSKSRQGREKWVKGRSTRILPKHLPAIAAAVCCLGVGVYAVWQEGSVSAVMSHLDGGFEYDDTLGRLQFVSNFLPESAMVFLTSSDDAQAEIAVPTGGEVVHAWSETEPWIEYGSSGAVTACQTGEVMTVVRNRQDEYTVRVMHDSGCESIYSGLTNVQVSESDAVLMGQMIGTAGGNAAFEWRRDGLSVQPVFSAQ